MKAGIAHGIVLTFLIFVGEDRVGLVNFLKFLFRPCIALITVGVVLHGQFAIGFLDFRLFRSLGHT